MMPRYTVENTAMLDKQCSVYLDGKLLDYVTECDTDLGFAIVVDKDKPSYRALKVGTVSVTFSDLPSLD